MKNDVMRYMFAMNINNSNQDGIIDLEEKRCICICSKDNSKMLLEALELYEKKNNSDFKQV